jgi:HEAT repeat protein
MNMRIKLLAVLAAWLGPCLLVCRGADNVLDSPMYHAPELPAPKVVPVVTGAKDLWLKALARPEAEMKCRAAQAIALARRHGLEGLDSTIAPLLAELDQSDQHATVALAVAQALIDLDAREAAPSVLRQAQSGDADLRDLVEPALARWDYRPARAMWLARLREPAAPRRSLVMAVRGLAAVHDADAAEPLRELVVSGQTAGPVRLEAARALGMLRTEGLEKDAERLAGDAPARGLVGRLAAASLLAQHQGDAAVRVLLRLAQDREPAVVAPAVARLVEIDPKLVAPLLDPLLSSPDAALRALAVEAIRRQPTEDGIRQLADRLDDPHPDVRRKARASLHELAGRKELRDRVIVEASRVLAGQSWRGLEQAAILLVRLDHKPAAGRLVELLTFDRPEVYVTAAWGLRKLAVAETLPAVLRHVRARQKYLRANAEHHDATFVPADLQLCQLNQLLGQQKYQAADAALREFIPRMEKPMQAAVCQESRAAAVWALGLLHEGRAIPELVTALEARLNDSVGPAREDVRVCRMAAVTLGRMKAKQTLRSLRRYCHEQKPTLDPINNACGWAIEQITGEVMQPPGTIEDVRDERFFLSPGG